MADRDRELTLRVGSTEPIEILLVGNNGQPEDLVGADRATFVVRESTTSAEAILERQTAPGATVNLSIDVAAGKLVATLTGDEADDLPPGTWIGAAAVRSGSDDAWKTTQPFVVRILPAIAPKV